MRGVLALVENMNFISNTHLQHSSATLICNAHLQHSGPEEQHPLLVEKPSLTRDVAIRRTEISGTGDEGFKLAISALQR